MNNLTTFIALEKLVSSIGHGRADLEFQVHAGKIVSVNAKGTKRKVYNRSDKDANNNQKALEDIVKRVVEHLGSGNSGKLTFTVHSQKDKIVSIDLDSEINKSLASAA